MFFMGLNIALLRGLNVGGKNILPMKDLTRFFCEAGCANVRTYIQSGNVIFEAEAPVLKELADEITRRIQGQFGYQIPVVLRTAAELHEAVISNPLMALPPNEKAHHVMFLAAVPDAEKAMQLEPDRSPGDEFLLRGRDVYLYLRNGAAKTKLTNAWFDRKLGTVSTARNWRTVLKLQELLIKNERA